MALALASSGLTSMIPMKTGGWWFSPSRLRDLLAIIMPMIAVTNRFNRQRSHQTGSRSEGDGRPQGLAQVGFLPRLVPCPVILSEPPVILSAAKNLSCHGDSSLHSE
jgi:hypothetical protein